MVEERRGGGWERRRVKDRGRSGMGAGEDSRGGALTIAHPSFLLPFSPPPSLLIYLFPAAVLPQHGPSASTCFFSSFERRAAVGRSSR